MADFLLSVGVDVGLSYDQIQKDISSLVSQLNSNPPKIKVSLDIDSAAITDLKNQIADISKSVSGTSKMSVGVNNTSGAKSAAADMASVAKNTRDAANAANTANAAIKGAASSTKILTQGSQEYNAALKRVNTLLAQVTHSQESWTAARNGKSSAEYQNLGTQADALRRLVQDMDSGTVTASSFSQRFSAIQTQVSSASTAIKAAGENTKTWGERIGALSAKFGTWLSITRVIMAGVQTVKQMVSNVVELDTAMTELKKVTDESEATYDKFLSNASSRAKELGSSLTDTVTASADFARLGYGIEDAEKLADAAIIYKNVGDGIDDISTASESIIATMQAFGVEAEDVMSIVDKFNAVGNNYAISSEGVGDALLRSAAAMHAAGNTLDETIALAAAANTVVQDPDKVGTTLKTVSMYLRAAKTEADEAGESTDGMANSVSELRNELLALTGNKVDIQIDEDTFKSSYQILKELSEVWNELSDVSQANITELIGGKRNANVISALMENFSVAEAAIETSANSAGSALVENEKVLESIQGKLNVFKATFQDLSSTLISDSLLKGLISSGTVILELINSIISALGGLGSTIGIIAGITAALNLTTVISKIKSIFETVQLFFMLKWDTIFNSAFVKGLQAIPAGLKMITTGSQAAASAFTMLGGAASIATVAMTAFVAILAIAWIAINKHNQKLEEQRQKSIENAQAAKESADNILELYQAYAAADQAYNSNAGSKESLTSATDALLAALGVEKSEIQGLVEQYGNLDAAIDGVTKKALQDDLSDMFTGFESQKEVALSAARKAYSGGNLQELKWKGDKESDTLENILFGHWGINNLHTINYGGIGTFEGVKKVYDTLLDYKEKMEKAVYEGAISQEDLNNASLYKSVTSRLDDLSDVKEYYEKVKEINETAAKLYYMDAIEADGIPKTTDDLTKLVDKIYRAGDANKQFIGSEEDVKNSIRDTLSTYSELSTLFEESFDKLSSVDEVSSKIKQVFGNSDAVQNSSWSTAEKQIQDFNSWVDGLSDEDKEIVYDVSVTTDTASWTLEDWRSQLSGLKDDTDALDALRAKIDAINDVKAGEIQFDIEGETSSIDNLQSAIQSSVSATGLTSDLISQITERYSALAGFNPSELFEKTANGIHLNAGALRELESEYETVNEVYLNTALDEQVKKYNDLSEKISQCTDASERASLIAEQNVLAQQIEQTATLASQYDGLTSAYQKWIDAQETGNEGDMYDNLADNLDSIRELYDKGLVGTDDFRAAVQLMTNFDISDWGIEDVIKAYENGYPLMTRYLTDGQEGCQRFLSDVSELNSEWAHMNEDGSWEIDFGTGNDQEIADKLGISVDAVQAILRKLSDYGFDIDLDSVFSDLGLIDDKLVSANERLKEIGATDIDFNFNSKDINDVEAQIAQAKQSLDSLRNSDGTLNVDDSDVQAAQTVLAGLIQRKQELSTPEVMHVDVSNATSEVEQAIGLLQQFHVALNEQSLQAQIGADTSEADTKVQSLTTEIQSLSPEIKASLGLNTESAATIQASIQAITPEIMVSAGVDETKVQAFQSTEKTAAGTVKWDNDPALVDAYTATTKTAIGTIKWGNNTDNVKTSFTATGTINWFGGGVARGTAFKNGSWGTKKSGIALGGELGQELVVRDGKFFTIGDYGAEFFRYKKDDIIFNAEQTKQIFEKGQITSGNRRGVALAEGTAFSSGTGRFYKSGTVQTVQSSSSTSNASIYTASDTIKASAEVEIEDVTVDTESIEDAMEDALKEMQEAIDDIITDYEHQIFIMEKQGAPDSDIIATYVKMQEAVHDYAEQYRAKGLDENSEYIQKMQKQWWDYQDSISDIIVEGYERDREELENAIDFQNIYMERAVNAKDYSTASDYIRDIINNYKNMQESVHDQAEYYRNQGYSDTSDEVSELSKLWWEYQENISSALTSIYENIEQHATDVLNTIQDVYSQLQDAADEYASYGSISIDTLQSIAELGVEYLGYLTDENGQLVLNRKNIEAAIAAKTKQYTVDMALSYVEQLRGALLTNDNDELNRLTSATDAATDSTWGLVYASLALLNLDSNQYANALERINYLRSLGDNALKSIGRDTENTLESANDSLEDIIDLVMDLIKYETEEHIDALEEQIDKYQEIIDLKKKSLQTTKDENDYNKEVAERVTEIAKLQSRINQLSLDDSREAQAEKAGLEEELAELQTDLADYQADYSLDKQIDMLDDEMDAYEEAKQEEITAAEESISSTEKLYRLAVERITDAWENDWDELFEDIIDWNYEAGSTIESEIVDKWNNATAALEKYILTMNSAGELELTRNGTASGSNDIVSDSEDYSGASFSTADAAAVQNYKNQMKQNSIAWMTAQSSSEQNALHSQNMSLKSQLESILGQSIDYHDGSYYIGNSELYSVSVSDVVKAMKANSNTWSTASASTQSFLARLNETLAEMVQDKTGRKVWKDGDGVWWIDDKKLYDVYHTGGIVGRGGNVKDNEVVSLLEKGELVLDQTKKDSLYEYIDIATYMLDKFGAAIDAMSGLVSSSPKKLMSGIEELNRESASKLSAIGERNTSYTVESIEIAAPIQVVQKLDDDTIKEYSRKIGAMSVDYIREGFTKRGVATSIKSI